MCISPGVQRNMGIFVLLFLPSNYKAVQHSSRLAGSCALALFSSPQNIVNVGVAMYEALAGTGALATEHTAVSEVLAAAARCAG